METTDRSSAKRSVSLWVVLGILGLLFIVFFLVQSGYVAKGKEICAVCKRPLHKAMTYTLISSEGKKVNACCPRCGLRSAIETGAAASQATDFSSGQRISAEKAWYLEGSQIMECCASPTMRAENGVICDMHYDRCQPSLLAFAIPEEAEKYRSGQGGKILSFVQARESVSKQMGR